MDFELIILFAFVEIVMDESASDDLKELRVNALTKVQRALNHYHHLGYIRELTSAIAEKKCQMIKEATSRTEMQKFLKERKAEAFLHFHRIRYSELDLDQPFLEQFTRNQEKLLAILSRMADETK